MDTRHLLSLREISLLVRTSTISIQMLGLMMKAIRFYRTARNEKLLADVHDILKDKFINWMKTGPKGNLCQFELLFRETPKQISLPPTLICDNAGVPKPTAITSDAVLKIIDPQEIGKFVTVIVHEDSLSSAYDALKYVATSDLFQEPEKGVRYTVVLHITGKQILGELKFSKELLKMVGEQNRATSDNTEWSLRAEKYRRECEELRDVNYSIRVWPRVIY